MFPKISIIVPVYNAEKTLYKCIDSIFNQSYKDWELLLIDDGSTDNSAIICDEYARQDKRIKVLHKLNGGVSSARNVGLDNAKGEWITFVDSDDYIVGDVLKSVPSFCEDIILFSFVKEFNDNHKEKNILSDNRLIVKEHVLSYLSENIESLIFRSPWSKLFKRELVSTLRFNEEISIGEDTLFVCDYLYKCNTIRVCADIFYVWKDNAVYITNKYGLNVEKSAYILWNIFNSYIKLHIKSTSFEIFIYFFYKNLCTKGTYIEEILWCRNKLVVDVWKRIKYLFPYQSRIKFYLLQFEFGKILYRICWCCR